MQNIEIQAKLLAQAVFEIRLLLAGYLGSQNSGDPSVRAAAHLAYALHNQALALLEGKPFSASEALAGIEAVDRMFNQNFTGQFARLLERKDV